jgi:hypothetical protein
VTPATWPSGHTRTAWPEALRTTTPSWPRNMLPEDPSAQDAPFRAAMDDDA